MSEKFIELWNRLLLLFFFSSRRRHTRSDRDWSSDVCSSDLIGKKTTMKIKLITIIATVAFFPIAGFAQTPPAPPQPPGQPHPPRSEERRVGKECGLRRARELDRKNMEKEETTTLHYMTSLTE